MEMSTQTKWFILLLAPCLVVFICQLPSYLRAFSQPWKELLPALPANTVMIAGASGAESPNFVRTKDGQYYHFFIESRSNNHRKWRPVEKVNEEARNNLIAGQYKFINPLIPFLFNRPPGTVIDHFYTEQITLHSRWARYRKYYVLLDGGTLWSWSEPSLVDHKMLERFSVIYLVIMFAVTGIMVLVMDKKNQPLLLGEMFIILFIATIIIFFFYTIMNLAIP